MRNINIAAILRKQSLKKDKPFYKKGEFIISAVLPSCLAIIALVQTGILSSQKQKIDDFEELLKNQQKQITQLNLLTKASVDQVNLAGSTNERLADQIFLLRDQLNVGQELRLRELTQLHYRDFSDFNKLYSCADKLTQLINENENDSSLNTFFHKARLLLEEGFANNVLLRNDTVFLYWSHAYRQVLYSNLDRFSGDNTQYINSNGVYMPDLAEIRQMKIQSMQNVKKFIHRATTLATFYIRRERPGLLLETTYKRSFEKDLQGLSGEYKK